MQRLDHLLEFIDLRSRFKENPVGVHQHDASVGLDVAKNFAGSLVENTVEGGGFGVRLSEVDQFAPIDVKGSPVDGRTLAGLVDCRN